MALLERQRVCKCLCLCCFAAQPEPIDHRDRGEASEEKQELWNGGDTARAVPGAGHMQGCSDLALCVLLPL